MKPTLIKKISIILFCFSAIGCTTVIDVQQEKFKIQAQLIQKGKETQNCMDKVDLNPKYNTLYKKITPNLRITQTLEQLNNKEQASPAVMQLWVDWYADAESCMREIIESYGRIDPELAATWVRGQSKYTAIINDSVRNRPTYAKINEELKAHAAMRTSDIKQYWQNLDIRLRQIQYQQLEQRAAEQQALVIFFAALEILSSQQLLLSQIQAANAPRITTTQCNYAGNTLFCNQF